MNTAEFLAGHMEMNEKIPVKLRKKSENLPYSVKAHLILRYGVGSNLCPFVSKII